ncbi:ABC transporter substrate-binding protein [Amycolatopsis jiangsuensis]|uniref:Iron complex transport system substrate-binding protein n=1 Tax=Amycolatopsis jiangsuensis TaxID=1181879 RepID=A0A840ITL2_9PSEU|nr:ABC transporter substrate-binding protein [Amycolatopsis jiangsuensis]MBB4685796.1 iron complex transport system substrate-binding protein [Amycolatopsis jiangsuensis]
MVLQRDVSRRAVLTGALGALGTLGLAACGSGGGDAAAPAGATRKVTTDLGEIEVPLNPGKVVAADFYPPFILQDLGITPAGVCEYTAELVHPAYRNLLSLPKIGPNGQPNVQEIAKLAPDLVVSMTYQSGRSRMQPVYDQLQAVAPTIVLLSSNQAKFWRECADRLAPMIGKDAEGKKLRAAYEGKIADIKKQRASRLAGHKWAYISQGNNSGTWTLNMAGSALGGVLADAGVQFGKAAAGQSKNGQEFSYEQFSEIADCDVIVYPVTYDGKPRQPVQAVLDQSTFRELPAVKAGRLHPMPNYSVASYRIATDALADVDKILAGL